MFQIEVVGVQQLLVNVEKNIQTVSDFRPLWPDLINQVVVARIIDIFKSKGDGTWAERLSGGDWPLLIKTGALFRSLTEIGDENNIYEADRDSVQFGSRLDRADYVQVLRPILALVEDHATEQQIAAFLDTAIGDRLV